MRGFRFPDGVEYLGDDGAGQVSFTVSIPIDEDGFFGRDCPACAQHFRMAHEDYEALPDDVQLWCVYCGHADDHSEFITAQQQERVMRAAGDYAQQLVGNMLDRTFGNMARRTRSSGVKITYRSRPFYPQPLPGIEEDRLVRERSCVTCAIRYAVFGEHRYCPVCGLLPPLIAALDSLDAERKRLQVLTDLPDDVQGPLRESGVLHRTYVDTIENIVGTVEVVADRVFRGVVPEPDASAALKGKGKIFQRLDDLADLYMTHVHINLRHELGPRWNDLLRAWATRHVFTHCDGVVDEKYLAAVPGTGLRVGQRVQIREADAQAALNDAELLCRTIARARP